MIEDTDWARQRIARFQQAARLVQTRDYDGYVLHSTAESPDAIIAAAHGVEPILDDLVPGWQSAKRIGNHDSWELHREASTRAIAELDLGAETREKLTPSGPRLSATSLHPWVWESARTRWTSGHYSDAVLAASIRVNSETQAKIRRPDLNEAALFTQAFSLDPPTAETPRLRRGVDDGSLTYKSRQRGAWCLAEGCFAGMRNPIAHADSSGLGEQEALEQLATLSVLARWVDTADLVEA